MKEQFVTVELLRTLLRYDEATGKLFWLVRSENRAWSARYAGKEAFTSVNDSGYKVGNILGYHFRASRVIYALVHGKWPAETVDHEDGHRIKNVSTNLRGVSQQVNSQNAAMPKSNTSGTAGVGWHKGEQKWRAYIRVNYKQLSLGYFKTKDLAIAAREVALREHKFHPNHGRSGQ